MGCQASKKQRKTSRDNRPSLLDGSNDLQKQKLITLETKPEERKSKQPKSLDKNKIVELFQAEHQQIYRNKKFQHDYFITEEKVLINGFQGKIFVVENKVTGLKRIAKIARNVLTNNQINEYLDYLQSLKKIDHPNIIKLFDFYHDDKHIYLVEEYTDGGDLYQRLNTEMHSQEKIHVAYVFQQVLSAINYLHSQDIIHKNITMSGVVIAQKSNLLIKLIGLDDLYNIFQDFNSDISYRAPETFAENYQWNKVADIWSAGIILFELMYGTHPFKDQTKQLTIQNIKRNNIKEDIDLNSINDDAFKLISDMINPDHKMRPNAKECLKYKFFKTIRKSSMKITSALLRIKEFQRKNELRLILLSLMIEYLMSKEERDKIAKTFQKIDINNDGKISKTELYQQYFENSGNENLARQEVDRIFSQLDINKNQFLEFNEFLIASCNKTALFNEENLMNFFNKLDRDHSKQISANELKVFFYNTKLSQSDWQQVIQLGEKKEEMNNKISYEEFISLLTENE
ncbi:unnamed protein product [Paramecium primaurelia]|uniref:Calcium-dependent protein kinase n=1 Tax=Paramecium primaurelia TaxID=5886 RepID=A0A8S1MLK5_PARPR|nr:unnamed protein product [Paramecium primaurelia]